MNPQSAVSVVLADRLDRDALGIEAHTIFRSGDGGDHGDDPAEPIEVRLHRERLEIDVLGWSGERARLRFGSSEEEQRALEQEAVARARDAEPIEKAFEEVELQGPTGSHGPAP